MEYKYYKYEGITYTAYSKVNTTDQCSTSVIFSNYDGVSIKPSKNGGLLGEEETSNAVEFQRMFIKAITLLKSP